MVVTKAQGVVCWDLKAQGSEGDLAKDNIRGMA
jgi:hypothetical protein